MKPSWQYSKSESHCPAIFFSFVFSLWTDELSNNGPSRPGKGSKGARLSCKTIEQIFDWVGLSSRGKFLRATESKDIDPLYLHFLPGEDYAWVHLTTQGLDTSFDVFPAYAPTSRLKSSMLYVFRYIHHTSTAESIQRWVLWDVAGKGVTLTEVLQDYCFPRLVTKPSAPDKFWVVLEDTNGGRLSTLVELRMDPTSITHWDRQMGELDGPGVSFLNHSKNKVDKEHVSAHSCPPWVSAPLKLTAYFSTTGFCWSRSAWSIDVSSK